MNPWYLLRIRSEVRIPFLYVTHNVGEAEVLAAEAIVLRRGRIVAQGPATDILRGEALAEADPSASLENVFQGTLESLPGSPGSARLDLPGGGSLIVPISNGPAVGAAVFSIAPEEILISAGRLERVSARNVLSGEIESIESSGSDVVLRLKAAGVRWRALLTSEATRELDLVAGRSVWIAVKTRAFRRLR
jgi:molybdate transport system ATP-binding protein